MDRSKRTDGSDEPVLDLATIPFSRFGSWLAVSPVTGAHRTAEDLHLMSHRGGLHPVLRLIPTSQGHPVAARRSASPSRLSWQHRAGRADLAFESPTTIRVRGEGLGLSLLAANPSLTPFTGPFFFVDPVDGSAVFSLYETGHRYRATLLSGSAPELLGEQALGRSERGVVMASATPWELVLEEFTGALPPYRSGPAFEEVVADAAVAFRTFLDEVAPWRDGQRAPATSLAAYAIWSAAVAPAGFVTRPAVLMSKHWMDKVWSWDHCFNAVALASGRPELAWGQFQLMFDHQDAGGALPDSVTHSEVLYNFVKPPIHGWALGRLRQSLPELPAAELAEAYDRLARWTGFWLTFRRVPGRVLPHYQHGNDSGWDNATLFDEGSVVESPDLASFLFLQLGELAELATLLGRPDEAGRWRAEAQVLRRGLVDELWDGKQFGVRPAGSWELRTADSLLATMPIVLGDELPRPVLDALADRIRRHLTAHGLATELPDSPRYQPDGYWRGPIWAPATVLIEDGLRRSGYPELADVVADRFLRLCERSGFAENFDALTGDGLRDRAYTWTAAAYLILAAAAQQRRDTVLPLGFPEREDP